MRIDRFRDCVTKPLRYITEAVSMASSSYPDLAIQEVAQLMKRRARTRAVVERGDGNKDTCP